MKQYILLITLILSCFILKAQPPFTRSTGVSTLIDGRLAIDKNLVMPRFYDTAAANLTLGLDSCGAEIFTRVDQSIWYRECSPKRWSKIARVADMFSPTAGSGIVFSGNYPTITIKSKINWYNIAIDGGADMTGTVDATSIIQSAINHGETVIYIPSGTVKVNGPVQMKDNVTIIGDGRSSIIKTTADTCVFKCSLALGGSNCRFQDFCLKGTYAALPPSIGTTSNQIGILTDSANKILVTNIRASNFKGCGIRMLSNGYCCATYVPNSGQSNVVNNCYFDSSYTGLDFGVRAEYNTVSGSVFTANYYSLTLNAGNIRIDNNTLVGNMYGIYITQGSNGSHGIATNNTSNHNDICLYVNGATNGFSFVNNVFGRTMSGGLTVLELMNSTNLKFIGGIVVANDTVRTTNCTGVVFIDQNYLAGDYRYVNVSGVPPTVIRNGVVSNTMSMKDVVNNKQFDLTHTNGSVGLTINGAVASIKVGVGTASPDSSFHVVGGALIAGGVRLSGLPTTGTFYKAIGVTSTGQLFLKDTAAATSLAIGSTITSATAGSVFYAGTDGVLRQSNSSFFYDSANARLGIGTSAPTTRLQVNSGSILKIFSLGSSATGSYVEKAYIDSNGKLVNTSITTSGTSLLNAAYIGSTSSNTGTCYIDNGNNFIGFNSAARIAFNSSTNPNGYGDVMLSRVRANWFAIGKAGSIGDSTGNLAAGTGSFSNIGIGTSSPTTRLQVNSGLELKVLSLGSSASGSYVEKACIDSAGKFTINALSGYTGNLIDAKINNSSLLTVSQTGGNTTKIDAGSSRLYIATNTGFLQLNDGNDNVYIASGEFQVGSASGRDLTTVKNIKFKADNTYDIGDAGATVRPRNLYLGSAATIGTNLTITNGAINATSSLTSVSGAGNANTFTTNHTVNTSASYIGTEYTSNITTSASNSSTIIGQHSTVTLSSGSNLPTALQGYGIDVNVSGGAGTLNNVKGVTIQGFVSNGATVTNVYGASFVGLFTPSTGVVNNQYGYYYDQLYITPSNKGYAFYSVVNPSGGTLASATDISIMPGTNKMVGIYTTSPTSTLTVNGSLSSAIVSKSADYTATALDNTILVTVTGKTITLPTAVGCSGREYVIKLTVSGTGTVATTSSQTIDGSTTYSLSAQYKYVHVKSDNANWVIIGNN